MSYSMNRVLITICWMAVACWALPVIADPPPVDPNDRITADLCASKTGDARENCLRQAQDRQISSDVRADARADSTDSNYNVARAKCDQLSGDARDRCIAAAKKKYKH
jgi:hypothetical protein